MATATVLLGRFDPRSVAAARPRVSPDAKSVATSDGTELAVPHYARALLRGWAGRELVEAGWADDVAATYLTVRLGLVERRTGLQLVGSPGYEREVGRELEPEELPVDWGAAR